MEAQKLFEILGDLECEWRGATPSGMVKGISLDSRKVREHYVFAAIKGSKADGHDYINTAVANGARVILCQTLPSVLAETVAYIKTSDPGIAYAKICQAYYDHPARKMTIVGVTGTNGKTTVATLLYQLFSSMGYTCGLLSTVENLIAGTLIPATHTTPDAEGIASLMQQMVNAGCTHAFMEVSSHALDQNRVYGLPFKAAIFTNITHDHLDYHGDFLTYKNAKKKFFDGLDKNAVAIINADDKNGLSMADHTKAAVKTYGLKSMADYRCKIISNDTSGLAMVIDGKEVYTQIMGEFNAYNLTAVYAVAKEMGYESDLILQHLSMLPGAEGRLGIVKTENTKITGVVDYAHTPDALENVLQTLKKTKKSGTSLITVFGCGGDRDRSKRPEMGAIAARLSDKVIVTSDNPRSEDPQLIIDQVLEGVPDGLKNKVLAIADRTQAIRTAVMLAQSEDIVLVAGKGHEKYQEIKGERFPFEDKKVLEETLSSKT